MEARLGASRQDYLHGKGLDWGRAEKRWRQWGGRTQVSIESVDYSFSSSADIDPDDWSFDSALGNQSNGDNRELGTEGKHPAKHSKAAAMERAISSPHIEPDPWGHDRARLKSIVEDLQSVVSEFLAEKEMILFTVQIEQGGGQLSESEFFDAVVSENSNRRFHAASR